MKTIKFRGRSCGEWYYGNLHIRKHEKFGDSAYIIGYTENPSTTIVDINTIGQFTGLHDKNGKEIYEGDIIKSSYGTIHYIVYDNDLACFKAVVARYNPSNEYSILSKGWIACLNEEVIGNIHDNPELLKPNKYETTTV